MTFITGPSLTPKCDPLIIGKRNPEYLVQVNSRSARGGARSLSVPLLLTACLLVLLLMGVGLMMVLQPVSTVHRYQGFCTIPIKDMNDESSFLDQPMYKVMPLHWSAAGDADADVQVLSAAGSDASDDVVAGLREQFDIADTVEKISVMDNGRHVNFIHDFEANVSGIVDEERCFMMDLDMDVVMTPEVLVLNIEGDAKFDISRVRATLRAALPALRQLAAAARDLRDKCEDKPVYRLIKEEGLIIRKRSADAPSHDYIHFAGRRVQEIEISNLAELLQHEQDNKLDGDSP